MDPVITAVIIGGVAYEVLQKPEPVTAPVPPPASYSSSDYLDDGGQATWGSGAGVDHVNDPDVQTKLDLLQQASKAAFDKLDAAGRSAAADAMNQSLNLDPPLTGNDTWDTVVKVAAGAAAAAGCNLIPGIGTAMSPLCAIGGAYLGVKLEDWVKQTLPDIESWATGVASTVVNSVTDAVKDAAGWLDNIF